MQREEEAGGGVAHVGVGGGVHGQEEVVDQLEQVQVGRGAQHFLDDLDEGETHLLRDGGQVPIPMLLSRCVCVCV